MTDRSNLAARIEAAGGPDLELDLMIAKWAQEQRIDMTPLYPGPINYDVDLWIHRHDFFPTASLDAAMMLVPEGAWFVLKNVMGPQPMTRDLFVADVLPAGWKDRPIRLTAPCATAALALSAAAIRAGGA